MSTDKIIIRDLAVPTLIGVYDFEREDLQTLRLDITLHTDITPAGQTDALTHALNYAAVAETILAFGKAASYELLEAFAYHLCAVLFDRFATDTLELVIHKDGCIPGAAGASLMITRQRSDYQP